MLKTKKNRIIMLMIVCIFFTGCATQLGIGSGYSMYPTFEEYDVFLINKTKYIFSNPKRGDIVGAYETVDTERVISKERYVRLIGTLYWDKEIRWHVRLSKRYNIKRVIGLPGETIEIINKQVYINGVKYTHGAEQFFDEETYTPDFQYPEDYEYTFYLKTRDFMEPVTIPENHNFILGDNRDWSRDSRHFGAVNKKDIIGNIPLIIGARKDGKWEKNRFWKKLK